MGSGPRHDYGKQLTFFYVMAEGKHTALAPLRPTWPWEYDSNVVVQPQIVVDLTNPSPRYR